jgi:hypothetical protein
MSAKPKPGEPEDTPEVAALRKYMRGETLTAAELALVERRRRAPKGPTVPHGEVERLLAERLRRGE